MTTLLVKTKSGKKGFVYYDKMSELESEKLEVHIVDEFFQKTGEKLLCELKSLTGIGYAHTINKKP